MLDLFPAPSYTVCEPDEDLLDGWCYVSSVFFLRLRCFEGAVEVAPLVLRSYQEELAEPALNGQNVIICAPTGSGKTYIAVKIVKDHIQKRKQSGKPFKLFPTTSLVDQQSTVLQKFITEGKLIAVKGGTSTPKATVIMSYDVVVMTPQLLLNVLYDSDDDPSHVVIGDFSLLIFDECHHVTKEHPYVKILRMLLTRKFQDVSTNSSTQVRHVNPFLPSLKTPFLYLALDVFSFRGRCNTQLRHSLYKINPYF
ncbi:unnamed protein product [Soboliphyme baturini]|uniref:Helicase ATP-binding domain-containing protein n=1 Tax=Soboliphyme baturini TaxID=241478 RepID=A0A183ITX3_9BILA|nr:unnamed protein product [Soboliphyme baturini]